MIDCIDFLEKGASNSDDDFARCCAFNLIYHASSIGSLWEAPANANNSVLSLMVGLGLRSKQPKRVSVLEGFFNKLGITLSIPWKKAIGKDLADAEHRCLRVQELRISEPTSMILMLDTFNEVLIQAFSRLHPALTAAYSLAAGPKAANPDYGTWLRNLMTSKKIVNPLPLNALQWLLDVHNARVKGDLAHAKSKKGKPTKPISYKRAGSLFGGGKPAWKALLTEWKKVL